MNKLLLLSLFPLAALANSCVHIQIPNVTACHVAGKLAAGFGCAETITHKSTDLNYDEAMAFLEAQGDRPDPKDPSKTLPAHGAAVIISSSDWNRLETALAAACRELGDSCTLEMKSMLKGMKLILHDAAFISDEMKIENKSDPSIPDESVEDELVI